MRRSVFACALENKRLIHFIDADCADLYPRFPNAAHTPAFAPARQEPFNAWT
jgi:hypothetical protein